MPMVSGRLPVSMSQNSLRLGVKYDCHGQRTASAPITPYLRANSDRVSAVPASSRRAAVPMTGRLPGEGALAQCDSDATTPPHRPHWPESTVQVTPLVIAFTGKRFAHAYDSPVTWSTQRGVEQLGSSLGS